MGREHAGRRLRRSSRRLAKDGAWRAELTQRAAGGDGAALVALPSCAKLAALDTDTADIAKLLAARGARLDTALEGVERALRTTSGKEREAFEARLAALLVPLRSTGSAKQKKLATELLESFEPSQSSGITPESAVQTLVTKFLSAKPRQRHALHLRLIDSVRDEPSVATLLPLP